MTQQEFNRRARANIERQMADPAWQAEARLHDAQAIRDLAAHMARVYYRTDKAKRMALILRDMANALASEILKTDDGLPRDLSWMTAEPETA